jgi:cytochrome c-type biogenesis protein CcmE
LENFPIDRSFRLGGMVAVGSFKREDLKSTFDVTDYKNKFSIEYTGILAINLPLTKEPVVIMPCPSLNKSGKMPVYSMLNLFL